MAEKMMMMEIGMCVAMGKTIYVFWAIMSCDMLFYTLSNIVSNSSGYSFFVFKYRTSGKISN